MKDTSITFTQDILQPTVFEQVSLQSALEAIRDGTYKSKILQLRAAPNLQAQKDLKIRLPAYHFSGTFKDSVTNNNLVQSSDLFLFDIDNLPENELLDIQKEIIAFPFCVFCFISPTQNGLKGAFRLAPGRVKNDVDFKAVFAYCEAFFKELGITIDGSCKDTRRACFVSYDANIYINYDAAVFDVPVTTHKKVENAPVKKELLKPVNEDVCIERIQNVMKQSASGSRHATRLKAAKLAGGYVASGSMSEDKAIDILEQLSDSIADNSETNRSELKTLKDGLEHGKQSPIYLEKKRNDSLSLYIDNDEAWITADEMARNAVAPNYLIDNVLETGTHGLLAGSSQAFKSFCVLKIAHSICTGKEFFGHEVYKTGTVMYICGEGLSALGRRIKAISIVEGGIGDRLIVKRKPLSIDNIADMAWLATQLAIYRPVLVIFDTFSSLAVSTAENTNEEVARVIRLVSESCLSVEASSIIVHHYGKDATRGTRGASAFSANVDFEWSMQRADSTSLEAVFSCKKSKDGEYFEDIFLTAHKVDLGIPRQNGINATSLILKESNTTVTRKRHKTSVSEHQRIALNAVVKLIQSEGIEQDAVLGIAISTAKREAGQAYKMANPDDKNPYASAVNSILKLIEKGILDDKDGFLTVKND